MSERPALGSQWLLGFGVALFVGALVVVVDAGLERPAPFGLRVTRVGQLLFVVAFVAGSLHFARRGRDWRALGLVLIAAGWALLFADRVLARLFGPEFVFVVLAVLVAGCAAVVYGIVRGELRAGGGLGEALDGD